MKAILEGLLYIQGDEGVTLDQVVKVLDISLEDAKSLVGELKNDYEQSSRGLRLKYLGNAFKLTTKEEHQKYYQKLVENPKYYSLSTSSLETLAIIAYKEPITRIEVEQLRGVDSTYVIRKLVAKGFIKECGKSDLVGHPALYKTTDEFLDYFNLASLDDLPDITHLLEEDQPTDNQDLFTSIYKDKKEETELVNS